MLVREERSFNIPWKKIGLTLLIVSIMASAVLIFWTVASIKSNSNQVKREARKEEARLKVIDVVSKKYYITCSKNIINPNNYSVIKVSGSYRIIVGSDTKNIDETHKVSGCGVMYDVNATNLRFKELL